LLIALGISALFALTTPRLEAQRAPAIDAETNPAAFAAGNRRTLAQEETLALWKAEHPRDGIEPYSPKLTRIGNDFENQWCARATLATPVDGGSVSYRTAYFYTPEPQSHLPAVTGETLLDDCRLGLIWTEVRVPDTSDPDPVAAWLEQSAAASLGTGVHDIRLMWIGSSRWRHTAFWKSGPVSLVTGATDESIDAGKPAAFVAAVGPASNVELATPTFEGAHARLTSDYRATAARIDEAIGLAAIRGQATTDMRAALAALAPFDPPWHYPRGSERDRILEAIDRWLAASTTVPAPRRAAALFVADQVLIAAGGGFWSDDERPPIRVRLEAHGAEFAISELDAGYTYTHTFLKQARDADPNGRAGELAYLTLMELGFETSGKCTDQGGEGFRTVIREGEAYLQTHPRSRIAPDVHLLLGEAYSDIVGLASGFGYDGDDEGKRYLPESAAARARAISEFRVAFNASPGPSRGVRAWPSAWRLLAGLPPTRTFFYCVYD
jgi:hypothetical protein